jgi:hypothetical protein
MDIDPPLVFRQYLLQLTKLIDKIEDAEQGDSTILDARLSADMLPLIAHVRIAANLSLRACCPLAGEDTLSLENNIKSFIGIRKQLSATSDHLAKQVDLGITDTDNIIQDKAGLVDISLPAFEYLHCFAFPNFYFHISMVYAIARQQGVKLSKGDFDGYHSYPPGFSWEK